MLPVHDADIERDAAAFSRALEAIARVYQLQDPRRTCTYGITLTECYALESIVEAEGEPIGVQQIAEVLRLDKSTVSRAVASLVRKGLARRRAAPRDGRAIELHETPSGARLHRRIREAGRSCYRALLADFPPEVREGATRLLQQIAAAERACADARPR